MQREVKLLSDNGIIRRSRSSGTARAILVTKKDGTKRLCVDYRELNKRMRTDSGGSGDFQGIFQRLTGSKWLRSIDLASRFHQFPIAEEDRHKRAFRDAFGQL